MNMITMEDAKIENMSDRNLAIYLRDYAKCRSGEIRALALAASNRILDLKKKVEEKQKASKCVWCCSLYRIEYYWIDREGNTASFQDEDRHIVATGVAKYCPNCGRELEDRNVSED